MPEDWDITDVSENCRVVATGHRGKRVLCLFYGQGNREICEVQG